MKNVLIALVLSSAVVLSSCSTLGKFGCVVEKQVVEISAEQIAIQLQCSDQKAIENDIFTLMRDNVGLCKEDDIQQTSIAGWICEKAGNIALGQLAKNIPVSWKCSAQDAKDKIADIIKSACNKAKKVSQEESSDPVIVHPVQPVQN